MDSTNTSLNAKARRTAARITDEKDISSCYGLLESKGKALRKEAKNARTAKWRVPVTRQCKKPK
ncbi:MAG: hypothetical protein V1728_03710 [Candidatus Micrarchaeota archaeon]